MHAALKTSFMDEADRNLAEDGFGTLFFVAGPGRAGKFVQKLSQSTVFAGPEISNALAGTLQGGGSAAENLKLCAQRRRIKTGTHWTGVAANDGGDARTG